MLKFLLLLLYGMLVNSKLMAQERLYDQEMFTNSRMPGGYYYSSIDYRSPSWIKNIEAKLPISDSVFSTPGNALQLQYTNGKTGAWQATILQQEWRGQDLVKPATTP